MEKAKRLPVVILGEVLPFSHSWASYSTFKESPQNTDCYFLVYSHEEKEMREHLETLHEAGISADQILLCIKQEFSNIHDPMIGVLEITANDGLEEFRQRLLLRLETQKHRKLSVEIERSRRNDLPTTLKADEWRRRLEVAHLTHGFCCALDLTISQHTQALRFALEGWHPEGAWAADYSWEKLLPLCAALALSHWQNPTLFREEFRKMTVALPFRIRTDLRNVSERCLEAVWRGLSHAAA